ncbi:MAG TPA: hypothetical protein VF088_22245 [Pyrinomonadaceae bacterium]
MKTDDRVEDHEVSRPASAFAGAEATTWVAPQPRAQQSDESRRTCKIAAIRIDKPDRK